MGYIGMLGWFIPVGIAAIGLYMLLKTETKEYIKNYHDMD